MRAPLRRGVQWRLISHLTLNYLSLFDGGREALQEILRLYDVADSAVVRQQIAGITAVVGRQVVGRPRSVPWNGFCRGLEVTIEFDEEKYVGSGVFLFAAVLERFLGLYTSLNSFTQLIAKTQQREETLKRWPPRAGEQILL
jgi:type VI secretion system protein ImpG